MSIEKRRQKVITQYEGIVKSLEEQGLSGTPQHTLAVEVLHTLKDGANWEKRVVTRKKIRITPPLSIGSEYGEP